MRIADKMQYEQVKTNVGKNRTEMSELQNQAATQKRVNKPSDDPLAASRVLQNRIDLQGNKQFSKSLNYARSFLEYTDQSLGDLSEVLMRAKELALNQANDAGANEESRRAVAIEVEQLYSQLINIGNRKLGDRFIFGGFRTQNAPFTPQGDYNGDPGEMNIHIDKEAFLAMNVPGGRVFMGQGIDRNGMAKPSVPQARSVEELNQQQMQQRSPVENRGPASILGFKGPEPEHPEPPAEDPMGVNLFRLVKDLSTSLRTNDKAGIQDSLNQLDDGLSQVVLTRAQVGSRGTVLDNFMQTLEKAKVDNQISISQLEDADIFSTVSDINKNESTLQATLQTSGKLIEKSLLDFLR